MVHGEIAPCGVADFVLVVDRHDSNPIYPLVTYLPKQLAAKRLLQTVSGPSGTVDPLPPARELRLPVGTGSSSQTSTMPLIAALPAGESLR